MQFGKPHPGEIAAGHRLWHILRDGSPIAPETATTSFGDLAIESPGPAAMALERLGEAFPIELHGGRALASPAQDCVDGDGAGQGRPHCLTYTARGQRIDSNSRFSDLDALATYRIAVQ